MEIERAHVAVVAQLRRAIRRVDLAAIESGKYDAIVCNYALWEAATVARVHGAGMKCLSYTVNDEWAAQRLIALGTDGIITDRVDLFSPSA